MSQLARRENAPHRAAFVTSLSRWYIRRLLGNSPPFHPCLSAERRPRFVPCGTSSPYGHIPWKSRYSKPFLSSCQCIRNWSGLSAAGYPITGGRFLRGLQSGYSVGQTVANSLKSHNHTQPTHTHSFSGQLVSTALSGTAAGQSFSSAANLGVSGWAAGQSITSGGAGGQTYQAVQSSGGTWISISQTGNDSGIAGGRVSIQRTTEEALKGTSPFGDRNTLVAPGVYESRSGGGVAGFTVGGSSTVAATTSGGSIWGSTGGGSISGTASGTVSGTTNASGVSGALRNGSVSGSIGAGGGTPTDYTGGAETAPDHIYVRCLIRAKP